MRIYIAHVYRVGWSWTEIVSFLASDENNAVEKLKGFYINRHDVVLGDSEFWFQNPDGDDMDFIVKVDYM